MNEFFNGLVVSLLFLVNIGKFTTYLLLNIKGIWLMKWQPCNWHCFNYIAVFISHLTGEIRRFPFINVM